MRPSADMDKAELFSEYQPRLFGLAYRMLGTRADAEDILQDTYLRLHSADLSEIENLEAWLVTVATRISIDRLRKASFQRETYIGPWLPEPLIVDPAMSPEIQAETESNLSTAFMVLLERLSPPWAEALTLITDGHVPDDVYESARREFSEQELTDLAIAVITVNSWNRLDIAFRTPAGSYQPGQFATMTN